MHQIQTYKYNPRKTFILPLVPCIYRVYRDDVLLYIGQATDDKRFLSHHQKDNFYDHGANKIKVTPCDLNKLNQTEKRLISYEKPILNIRLQNPENRTNFLSLCKKSSLEDATKQRLQKVIGSNRKAVILKNSDLAFLVSYVQKTLDEANKNYPYVDKGDEDSETSYEDLMDKANDRIWDLEALLADLGSPPPGWE